MPTPVQNLIKIHSARDGVHGWQPQNTDHIKNVSLKQTHLLMKCPCGWYGWVKASNNPENN